MSTNQGEKEIKIINGNEVLQKHASNARGYLKGLQNFDGTSKIVHFVRFLGKDGLLICIVRARPEGSARAGDNFAVWIHVPSRIHIAESELYKVVSLTEEFFVTRDITILEDILKKEYEEKNLQYSVLDNFQSNPNGKLGAIYHGEDTMYVLEELCNLQLLANKSFNQYRAILLIDNSDRITIEGEGSLIIPELSSNSVVTLSSPLDSVHGFRPYIEGNVFNKDVELFVGQTISMFWKKNGYKDIKKTVLVKDNDDFQRTVEVQDSDIIREILRSIFQIVNKEDNSPIKKCVVLINDIHFLDNKIYIKNSDYLRGVTIRVTADGYNTHEEHSVSLNNRIVVLMTPTRYKKEYILPAKYAENIDGNITVILESVGERIYSSPFKGYKIKNDFFIYANQFKLKAKYFFLGVIAMFAIILAGVISNSDGVSIRSFAGCSRNDNSNDNDSTGIDYLNRERWVKSEMEKFKCLEGLFDELDGYEYQKIKDRCKKYNLYKSSNYKEIVDLINNPYGINGIYKYRKKFLNQGDDAITVAKYIDKLDEAKSKTVEYLDGNQEWNKEQLDIHAPCLFDDLNDFKFEQIKNWGEELKDCEKLSSIVEIINSEEFQKENFKLPVNNQSSSINVDNYINNLKEKGNLNVNKNTATPNENGSGQGGKPVHNPRTHVMDQT